MPISHNVFHGFGVEKCCFERSCNKMKSVTVLESLSQKSKKLLETTE